MRVLRVLVVLTTCVGCGGPSAPTASETVDVDDTMPGAAIADDFLGLSVEWFSVDTYLGDGKGGARPQVVKLLAPFNDEGHRVQVRIGGNSEDVSWWNPNGMPKPAGVTFDITPQILAELAALQTAAGNKLTLGLDLALGDAVNAAALVDAAKAAFAPGGIAAFGLGNEPDSYAGSHRPDSYDWPTYLGEVHAFSQAVSGATNAPPFLWPELAGKWDDQLAQQIPVEKGIAIVSTHAYPYSVCAGLPAPKPADLLRDYATSEPANGAVPLVKAAHAAGMLFRLGEMNSVSCGGAPGVSDTYASALWAADAGAQLARVGVDGIDFHGGAPAGGISYYAAFVINADGTPTVRPLYYGLRMLSLWSAQQGRLIPVTLGSQTKVHGYATIGSDGAVRVLLLSMGADAVTAFKLRSTGAHGSATLVRLHASALDATSGLALGGQTWDGASDGAPVGALATETLNRQDDGWYVSLPPYDAVVITLKQ
jgi:hypothetical protein